MTDVDPAVADLSRRLLPDVDQLGSRMAERIRGEVALYRETETVPTGELEKSCRDNLRYVLGNLAGAREVDSETPRQTGSARAEQGVPYAAVLQAYRVGGRFIWELLVESSDAEVRDKLLIAAADIWAVTDDLSSEVTEGYRTSLAEGARRDGQRRSALLGNLLDEVAVAELLWESANLLNLPQRSEFVVVAAESPSPGQEALPDVERLLQRRDVVSVWRLAHDHQEGLVCLRIGFRFPELVAELKAVAQGRAGLSATFTGIDRAQAARREARLACTSATPGTNELVRYDEHPIAILVASTPEWANAFARSVLGPVLDLPDDDRTVLLDTARTWLLEAGATSAAAKRLFLHRNTVRYRMRRLEELTGRNLAQPVDAADIYVALECVRILDLA